MRRSRCYATMCARDVHFRAVWSLDLMDGWRWFGMLVLCCLALVAAASGVAAAAPFTWSGQAPQGSADWSTAANWQGGLAPELPGPVALSFPRLEAAACEGASPSDSCYHASNDLGGLAVESLSLDDGDEYKLEGEAIGLGVGGLTAAPAAACARNRPLAKHSRLFPRRALYRGPSAMLLKATRSVSSSANASKPGRCGSPTREAARCRA